MIEEDFELKDILILFDRDSGISIFKNLRVYDNAVDDAEWILERNPKTKGFILRPVAYDDKDALWVGEYAYNENAVTRIEVLSDKAAGQVASLITSYVQRKITEREVREKLSINLLKAKIGSEIVRGFKYYECPLDHFYHTCSKVKKLYEVLKEKYGDKKVPYSNVGNDILNIAKCSEAIICPLRAPNALERVYNLDRALKSRGLGGIIFISPGILQIT